MDVNKLINAMENIRVSDLFVVTSSKCYEESEEYVARTWDSPEEPGYHMHCGGFIVELNRSKLNELLSTEIDDETWNDYCGQITLYQSATKSVEDLAKNDILGYDLEAFLQDNGMKCHTGDSNFHVNYDKTISKDNNSFKFKIVAYDEGYNED